MIRKLHLLAVVMIFTVITTAQETCDAIVQTAIDTAAENCDGLRRNEACYGNVTIDAEASPEVDEFVFDNAGDIVNVADIASMRHSSNLGNGDWGISILSLRAGQRSSFEDVRVALIGNVTVTDASHPLRLPVIANGRTRLRSSPSTETDFNILQGIDAGAQLEAIGRTENGEWLRVHTNGATGWITALLVDGDASRMDLPVVEFSEPYFGPMQAFTIQTGDGTDCADVPPDGLLIQTPEGAGLIEFRVNEVSIWLGSTAFVTITGENNLRTYLLEGQSNITAQGQREFIPPGTFVDVPLDINGIAPAAPPSPPQPYDADDVASLPVNLVAQPETEPIVIADPVAEGGVSAAIADTFISNPYGIIDGWYRVSVTSFEQVNPNQFTDGFCRSGGTVFNTLHTEFSSGFSWDIINVESLTSFTFTSDNSDTSLGGCIVGHRAVWVPSQPR